MIQSPAGYQGDVRIKRYLDFYQAGYGVAMLMSGVAFSPLSLFAAGEQGAWYDPSDFSTMFTDAAGTTPVTAVEQPVGLLLDKSKGLALGAELVTNGTFDSGITGWTKGAGTTDPISWDSSGKRLIITNDIAYFGSASQTLSGLTVGKTYLVTGVISGSTVETRIQIAFLGAGTSLILPAGGGTARFVFAATSTSHSLILQNTQSTLNGISYWDNISVRELPGNHASQSTAASRPVLSARVNALVQTENFSSTAWDLKTNISIASGAADPVGGSTAFTITSTSAGGRLVQFAPAANIAPLTYLASVWMRRRTGTGNINWETPQVGLGQAITLTTSWQLVTLSWPLSTSTFYYGFRIADSGDAIDIWHPDLRVTNVGVNLPAYQRVAAATDYDTSGFPLYLKFDGVDDSLATGTIDPGAVDKAQVFAGLRKISGTGFQAAVGYGFSQAGAYYLYAPTSVKADYGLYTTGNTGGNNKTTDATFTPPISGVVSGFIDGALAQATQVTMRVNGSSAALSAGGAMTLTSIAAEKIYLGRRQNADLPFNGNLYGVIVRFGANLSDAQIASTETYVNNLTKAY